MMGIFSKGWSTSKSGSPVMMQSALPEMASSRYLSSFGSRHIFMALEILMGVARDSTSSRNNCRNSIDAYLSNFDRINTSITSLRTAFESNREEVDLAFSKAWPGAEVSDRNALINTLQSNTSLIYFSLSNSSRISGVRPFFLASSLASFIISSKLFLFDTIRSNVSEMDFFSAGVILATFSATGSLTSSVIVFILQR